MTDTEVAIIAAAKGCDVKIITPGAGYRPLDVVCLLAKSDEDRSHLPLHYKILKGRAQ